MISWSMAKSITHALVGIAVAQGQVNVDAPMGSPHWKADDPRAKIPWRIWLQMTDGQRYIEDFARNYDENDAFKKLYGPGTFDVAAFCAGLPLIHKPGTFWNYNSCALVLSADALTRTIVPSPSSPEERRAAMLAWMHKVLLDVIGISDVQPEFDASGLYYGSASFYATARDFAKFGLLYLRDGVWDGQRILPVGWVDFARTQGPGTNADVYGAGWWITPKQGLGVPEGEAIVTGPQRDAFVAIGHEGQFIVVVPSKDLIIVRLGLSGDEPADWAANYDWLARVGQAFPVVNPGTQ
jgi:CubicO group peptidase (beta-lactamase class C family)